MTQYSSYLESFHSGSYISHIAYAFDAAYTFCGLHISSLTTLEAVGEVISLIACPRCLAKVEAQMPRIPSEQAELLDWSGNDGR